MRNQLPTQTILDSARSPVPGSLAQAVAMGVTLLAAIGIAALAHAEGKAPNDMEITDAIESELWLDDAVDSNNIDIATNDGIVTFDGAVDSILAKDRAEAIAANVVGVRGIINEVEVSPAIMRPDNELKEAVEDTLIADPAADAYELEVEVNDGTITLKGTVESWQERQLSETVVKGVRGVRGIENRIAVNYEDVRYDDEIDAEVSARLENDVRVDDAMIDVDVTDGIVKLEGMVGSLSEKRQAEADAWVSGVRDVVSDNLHTNWGLRDDMRRSDLYQFRTDEQIKEAVDDSFLYDPRVLSFEPEVSVRGGNVTLSGVVDNLEAKLAAEDDARNVVGVRSVDNNLKVRIPMTVNDNKLTKNVRSALADDPYVERFDVDVSANRGWVTLDGDVNTSFESNHAEIVALGIMGVTRVFNNIDYEYDWEYKPDWEVEEDVVNQLWWSPFVDSDEVNVAVDDGIVTLSGTVDTWSERNNAADNAFEGGAKDVQNNLDVEFESYGPYPGYGTYPAYGPPIPILPGS